VNTTATLGAGIDTLAETSIANEKSRRFLEVQKLKVPFHFNAHARPLLTDSAAKRGCDAFSVNESA
jgi:hypothetical protein